MPHGRSSQELWVLSGYPRPLNSQGGDSVRTGKAHDQGCAIAELTWSRGPSSPANPSQAEALSCGTRLALQGRHIQTCPGGSETDLQVN